MGWYRFLVQREHGQRIYLWSRRIPITPKPTHRKARDAWGTRPDSRCRVLRPNQDRTSKRRCPRQITEEVLIPKDDLQRIWVLRKVLNPLSPVEAMEWLITYLEKSLNNAEFLTKMNQLWMNPWSEYEHE
jgi:hypothetical protein